MHADDDNGGEATQTGRGATAKRRAAVTADPSSTLEPNIEALNVKKFDIAFAVDPLFHKTSAQFDEGGARGESRPLKSLHRPRVKSGCLPGGHCAAHGRAIYGSPFCENRDACTSIAERKLKRRMNGSLLAATSPVARPQGAIIASPHCTLVLLSMSRGQLHMPQRVLSWQDGRA